MVEFGAQLGRGKFQLREVDDEARPLIGLSRHGNLDEERVAVQPSVDVAFWGPFEVVRGIESELDRDFHTGVSHQRNPSSLCVCRLSRHRGWARQ